MNKPELLEALEALGVDVPEGAKKEELEALLEANQPKDELVDHVVTQEDLDANPELSKEGVAVGDTIQVPADDAPVDEASEEESSDEDRPAEEAPADDAGSDDLLSEEEELPEGPNPQDHPKGSFVCQGNLKCDGVEYGKGDLYKGKEGHVEGLVASGVLLLV